MLRDDTLNRSAGYPFIPLDSRPTLNTSNFSFRVFCSSLPMLLFLFCFLGFVAHPIDDAMGYDKANYNFANDATSSLGRSLSMDHDTDQFEESVPQNGDGNGKAGLAIKPVQFILAKSDAVGDITSSQWRIKGGGRLVQLTLNILDGWSVYAHDSASGHPIAITLDSDDKGDVEGIEILWPDSHEKIDVVLNESVRSNVYRGEVVIPILVRFRGNTDAHSQGDMQIESDDNAEYNLSNLALNVEYGACGNGCMLMQEKIRYGCQSSAESDGNGCPSLGNAFNNADLAGKTETDIGHIILMILMAIIGGFILNLMPCVLPIISLKIFHFVKYSKFHKREIRLNLLLISLGIMLFFWTLSAITIFLKRGGVAVGWGMHFQEPMFISILVSILLLLSINMLGFFEITLPTSIGTRLSTLGVNSTYLNSALSGILISVLATPCTAPFLSTAIAFAITQDYIVVWLIYTGIAIGMSTPYLLIAIVPKAIKLLPKPGAWMETFRKVLSIPLLAAVLWLMYVLYMQTGLASLWFILNILAIFAAVFLFKFAFAIRSCVVMVALLIFFAQVNHHNGLKFDESGLKDLNAYVDHNEIVLVNITADWCLTCKFNEAMVMHDIEIKKMLNDNGVILVQADYTKKSRWITQYLSEYRRYGIPLSVIYGPAAKHGIVLPEILSKQALIDAIERAR